HVIMIKLRTEFKTLLFFTVYILVSILGEKSAPSGPCTSGAGFLLFLLLIPVSIIMALIFLFKYYKSENKEYVNSFYIILVIWTIIFLFGYFND
ncbi:hypothetical protein, partial [Flavobacterium sp.]|uniref:hypothetical protein n=1 Tax=Flavobacterium sp. TaxID=239 RepID=UPI0031E32B3C